MPIYERAAGGPGVSQPDEALRPLRATLSAAAAGDEIGDAVVRPKLAPEHFEVGGGAVVALPDVAINPHVKAGSDHAAEGPDLRRASPFNGHRSHPPCPISVTLSDRKPIVPRRFFHLGKCSQPIDIGMRR